MEMVEYAGFMLEDKGGEFGLGEGVGAGDFNPEDFISCQKQ